MEISRSEYFMSLSYEAKKRYTIKLTVDGEVVPDPYAIPHNLWLDDMFVHLINTKGLYTKDKLKAYKSFEAHNYYYNGFVQTVYYYDTNNLCVHKAKVNQSQKLADNAHEAWVILSNLHSVIQTTHCKCMAG